MFSEHRDLINRLKNADHHFAHLVETHDQLDRRITDMETGVEVGTHEKVETLKKEKLLLKDQVYKLLQKALAANS